jgi:hypothetical protein
LVRSPGGRGLRMFYSGAATEQVNESAWDLWATGTARSRDGRHWTLSGGGYEPVLRGRRWLAGEVVDPADRSSEFDSMEARAGSVLVEVGGWSMWYTGWNGDDRALAPGRAEKTHFQIGLATSPDGERWTKRRGTAAGGAVLGRGASGEVDSEAVGNPTVMRDGPRLSMWYEAYDGTTWRIAHATSADGLTWERHGAVLHPGPAGSLDELGARRPVVLARPGGYELWYQGRSRSPPSGHVLVAVSSDGREWRKRPGEVTLHPDPPVQRDEEVRVGSVLARADGGRDVFFAKESAARRGAWLTPIAGFAIFVESVAAP